MNAAIMWFGTNHGTTERVAANASWYEIVPEGIDPPNEIAWKYCAGTPGSTSDGSARKPKRE